MSEADRWRIAQTWLTQVDHPCEGPDAERLQVLLARPVAVTRRHQHHRRRAPVAGLLTQALTPALAVAFDAASYLASAVGIGAARTPEPPPAVPEKPGGVFEGIRQLFRNRYPRALTISAAAYNAAYLIITVNLVVYVVTVRGAGPGLYGLALSAGGMGSLLGALVALPVVARLGFGRAMAVSILFSSVTPVLYAVFPLSGGALAVAVGACQFVAGIGGGSANVLSTTLRQVAIPASALARTTGSYRFFIFGTIPIGTVLGGVLGSALGSRWGIGLGAIGLVLSMVPLLRPMIRRLPTAQAAAEPTGDGQAVVRPPSTGRATPVT